MKKKQKRVTLLLASLLMSGFLVTGCTNNDYDFDNIDATIGFGGEGLELPASSTDDIMLKDVLELKDNGSVVEDATTHDYVFRQEGNAVDPVNVSIRKVLVKKAFAEDASLPLEFQTSAKAYQASRAGNGVSVTAEGNIYNFEYNGDKPAEVVALSSADVNSVINLQINFPTALAQATSELDQIQISFPSYMKLAVQTCSVSDYSLSGTLLKLNHVSTSRALNIQVKLEGLDCKAAKTDLGEIAVGKDKISLKGHVHMRVVASNVTLSSALQNQKISSRLQMDDIEITGAQGRFNPSINLNNLGRVNITGIPDFLEGGNVVVDLYNPQIKLTISNDMAIEGIIDGTIESYKNGRKIASVSVDDIRVGANRTTDVCICRHAEGVGTHDVVKVVPNLSDVIKTIPDYITFTANARANSDVEGKFLFGHTYQVKPAYSVDAPIAFAENAVIEYSDDFDGWNDDLDELQLADGTYLSVTANAQNKVPATLVLQATPLGVGGTDISDLLQVEIKQGTVAASVDGTTPSTSPLEIEIREKVKGGLKKLDGLSYKVLGKATDGEHSVVGVTLNAEKHTLKLSDIKIKLVGKVIGDFN